MLRLSRRAALGAAAAAWALPAAAQDFPARPLRLMVPFPPGGGTDVLARVMAARFGEWLGQSVVVENRGGAGGAIGTLAVARAPGDAHLLLFTSSPPIVVLPASPQPPGYDPERELTPIATLARQAILFVVRTESPHRDLASLLRAAGGQGLSYGSPGVGTDPHLAAEVLRQASGAQFVHVPYRGGGPAMTAVLSGEVEFNPALTGVAKPLIAQGRLRALAVTSPQRLADFPDVPTTTELGMPEVDLVPWWALFGPPGLPSAAVQRLSAEARRLSQDPEWLRRLESLAIEPFYLDGAATGAAITAQLAGWRQRLPNIPLS
jgi:tripartite-type tricarboxylate transporter receptor subunit TctC